MLCQKCKKSPATNHYHSVIGGVVSDSYLCSECAAELKFSFSDNSIFKMFSDILTDTVPHTSESVNTKMCEICNTTFADIKRFGKVGCSNCYNVFYEELKPSLQRIHGQLQHNGKVPREKNRIETVEPSGDVSSLKAELKKAIEMENYEKAAILRDEIKRLETEE